MTDDEHRHRWILVIKIPERPRGGDDRYVVAYCPGCREYLNRQEIKEHLNEYENMKDYIIEQVGIEHVPKKWGGELE